MIKSILFTEDYELPVEKESQKRWGVKTYQPSRYTREKKPWDMFTLFKKDLRIDFFDDINIIVGENGSGKSTLFSLIKLYAGKQPDKLDLVFSNLNEDDYIKRHRENYNGELQVDGDISYKNTIFFSAEDDNPVVAIPKMLNPNSKDFMGLSLNLFEAQVESHGESMKPILEYILSKAKNCSIFLDEPETALSLKNQFWLVNAIRQSAVKNGNQIFVSTHALALINQFFILYDMENREWRDSDNYIKEILKDVLTMDKYTEEQEKILGLINENPNKIIITAEQGLGKSNKIINMKEKVIDFLKSFNTGKTPTEIGLALGKTYNSASSSVTPALKKLVADDLVVKTKIDGKILYAWKRK